MTEAPPREQRTDDVEPPFIADDEDHSDHRDDGKWITVATFWTPALAQLARLKLESEEIDCVLFDENFVAVDWLMANAVGGIKLKVREADAPAARTALERPAAAEQPPDESESEIEPFVQDTCPECGSDRVARPWVSRHTIWAGVVALMLSGVIVPLIPLTAGMYIVYLIRMRPWKCGKCGSEWSRLTPPAPQAFPVEPIDDAKRTE